jgi:hypothetical protein
LCNLGSCVGGGLKGLVPFEVVARIQAAEPGLIERAHVWAGTSIGSIVAAFLSLGRPASEAVDMLRAKAAHIFGSRDAMDSLVPGDEYWRAAYDGERLKEALYEVFGGVTLGQVQKKLVIPTFYLGDPKRPAYTKVWHNFGTDAENPDRRVRLIDVLDASSSAPTYFRSATSPDPVRYPGKFADGGLTMNDPVAAGITKMLKVQRLTKDVRPIRALALTCGSNPFWCEGGDWGPRQWVVHNDGPLLHALFDGQVGVSDSYAREILEATGGAYHRVDPKFKEEIALDDVDKIADLLEVARAVDIRPTIEWLRQNWA